MCPYFKEEVLEEMIPSDVPQFVPQQKLDFGAVRTIGIEQIRTHHDEVPSAVPCRKRVQEAARLEDIEFWNLLNLQLRTHSGKGASKLRQLVAFHFHGVGLELGD